MLRADTTVKQSHRQDIILCVNLSNSRQTSPAHSVILNKEHLARSKFANKNGPHDAIENASEVATRFSRASVQSQLTQWVPVQTSVPIADPIRNQKSKLNL